MKNQTDLLNWNTSKGNPYDYKISDYTTILTKPFKLEFLVKMKSTIKKNLKSINLFYQLKLVSKLEIEFVPILSGYDNMVFTDKKYLDWDSPVYVWITYPLGNHVRAKLYPIVRKFSEDTEEQQLDYLGCLIWQIAKVYADIYKNHWQEANIWGHGFEDLILERIVFVRKNEIELCIGS